MEKKKIKDKLFVIISFVVYMIITFIITMFHENWRDEAQSFMIAKSLSFIDIFKQLKYEGHPFVFYYLVRIFTLFGFGYRIVNIISWIVMSIVAYIILAKSPFNKPTRVLILLTVPFIYQYVAFGRSYCLVTLFTILLAYLYDKKEKHPYLYAVIIALLMNTHIIMFGFCMMLVISFYVYELIFKRKELDRNQKKKYIISLIIILIALILLVFQFCNTLSLNSYAKIENQDFNVLSKIKECFDLVAFNYTYVLTNNFYVGITMSIIILATIIFTFKLKVYKEIVILIGSIGFQLLFFTLLSQTKSYILMTGWIIYVFYLWVILNKQLKNSNNKLYKTIIEGLIIATCLISIIFGSIKEVYDDLRYEYSSSRAVAKYINNNIEKDSVFICVDDTLCGSIIPYVSDEYRFYSLNSDSYYKYVNWDENRNNGLLLEEYFDKIDNFLENNKQLENIYIIFNNVPNSETYKYLMKQEKIQYEHMAIKSYAYTENYYIYKIVK